MKFPAHSVVRMAATISGVAGSALALNAPAIADDVPVTLGSGGQLDQDRCQSLATAGLVGAPVRGLIVTATRWHEAGLVIESRGGKSPPLPSHCEIEGYYGEYAAAQGGVFRTGFRMRLPKNWNQRFLFQGGGGSNGIVGDATGPNGVGNTLALARGYAVLAQDSGHDNVRNNDPTHGGILAFGLDPRARAAYGHTSLKTSYDLARHFIRIAYRREPSLKIFWGCSKGGQEGMAFAQRYPEAFDGIVAASPGFSLPRAAVAQAWNVQALSGIIRARSIVPSVDSLKTAFSLTQSRLVREAIVAACDALDGSRDGMVAAVGQCTTRRVLPELRSRQCKPGAITDCIEGPQIDALLRVTGGAQARGKSIYAPFPWDPGLASPGWLGWQTGLEGEGPARNVILGAGSLAAVFTTPPTILPSDAQKMMDWQLDFDFDRDAGKIYTVRAPFTTSAWEDVGMRSANLSAFAARGGKMIVPHGMADPVFSAYDTIAWWNEVNRVQRGRAGTFVRVFPVPGMNHCGGGPATDRYDSLAALEAWVTTNRAPDQMQATAGPDSPWPGRERPVCAYPTIAVSEGKRFVCRKV